MMNNTPETTKPPALSRTWRVLVEFRPFGEFWGDCTYEVTLTREFVGGPLCATIDGLPAELERALNILGSATRADVLKETLSESAPTPPEAQSVSGQTIGKSRAAILHKIMGALGIPHARHYSIAAYAIDEPLPLCSLSGLTHTEAARVWAHLCRTYAAAREVADRIKAKTAAPARAA